MNIKNLKRKLIASIMSGILLLSAIPLSATTVSAAETGATPPNTVYVSNANLIDMPWKDVSYTATVSGFTLHDGNDGVMVGVCAQHGAAPPTAGTEYVLTTLGNTYTDGDLVGTDIATDWAFKCFYYTNQINFTDVTLNGKFYSADIMKSTVVEMAIRSGWFNGTYPLSQQLGTFRWDDNVQGVATIHSWFDQIIALASSNPDQINPIQEGNYWVSPQSDGTIARLAMYAPSQSNAKGPQRLLVFTPSVNVFGYANLVKTSANPAITNGNSCYSLAGAVYGVYTDWNCTNQVGTFTTDQWGNSNTVELNAGTYYVKELTAPMGYALDPNIHEVTVTSGQTATVYVTDLPQSDPIFILLKKQDSETAVNIPQGSANLENAEFTVKYFSGFYNTNPEEQGIVPTRQWILRTDINGVTSFFNAYKVSGDEFYYNGTSNATLPLGTITIQETKAPEGYLINSEIFVRQITSAGTDQFISTYNAPVVPETAIRGGVRLQKRDFETGSTTAQGNATLSGAVFEITNTGANPVMVEGTLYQPNEVVKTVTTGADGSVTVSADVLPYGSYRVDEVTAPDGYLQEGVISRTFDIRENGVIVDLTDQNTSILNQIKRGDLELIKVEDGTNHRMKHIPFQITSKTTGESHVIVTDENGCASTHASWNSHLQNTNAGQTSADGIWFGTSQPDDTKGALPYDTYILDELPCANNEGKYLLKGIEITISRDNHTVNLGTLTNDNIPKEGIVKSTAKDQATGSNQGEVADTVTIVDTVQYENLKVGVEYTLHGILMDKATNAPLLINGEQVTAQTVFTPTQPNGTVDVTFTFDGSQLWEKEVVVFDTLYRNGTEVAVHADITDKGQTVTFPKQPQEPEIPTEPPVPSEPKVPQTPKTGDNQWLLPTLISSLLVSTGILFAFVFHQKKHGENRRS